MTCWELQNQWRSKDDVRRDRVAKSFIRGSIKPATILRDAAISLLIVVTFLSIWIGF